MRRGKRGAPYAPEGRMIDPRKKTNSKPHLPRDGRRRAALRGADVCVRHLLGARNKHFERGAAHR